MKLDLTKVQLEMIQFALRFQAASFERTFRKLHGWRYNEFDREHRALADYLDTKIAEKKRGQP